MMAALFPSGFWKCALRVGTRLNLSTQLRPIIISVSQRVLSGKVVYPSLYELDQAGLTFCYGHLGERPEEISTGGSAVAIELARSSAFGELPEATESAPAQTPDAQP
jgi:hypothetical protein